MFGNKLTGFLSGLCAFLCRFFRNFRCFDCIRCATPGFCGGVLPLDRAFLLPAGIRIGGKAAVLLFKLLIQRFHIGLIRLFLRPVRLAVWLKLVGVMNLASHLIDTLSIFRQRVGGIHTGVIAVIALLHFPVNTVQHRVAGNLRRVAGFFSSKERRVVIFPSESTTRCLTSFFGTFASAFSSFLIRLSAFWMAGASSGEARSSSVNCSLGARFAIEHHLTLMEMDSFMRSHPAWKETAPCPWASPACTPPDAH